MAQALTLKESFQLWNPGVNFYIGLVDIPVTNIELEKLNILPVNEIVDADSFNHMAGIYNITELSTAVKPHFIEHFFNKLGADKVVYLDPDIVVFDRFDDLFNLLDQYSVLVTPHYCSPPSDNRDPTDLAILNTGVYNLGFVSFSKTEESLIFINWWKRKLLDQCFAGNGMFTDQLWMNFVTCFCNKVFVLRNPGYNMANWNLHERQISKKGNKYFVNDNFPLVFFHFSNYKLEFPEIFASYNNRFLISDRPDIHPVLEYYQEELIRHGIEYYRSITPQFGKKVRPETNSYIKKTAIKILNKIIHILS